MRLIFRCFLAASLGLFACPASAQTQHHAAAAEVLFEEARRLAGDGKWALACQKFAESNKLDPAVGTMLNLGRCYEKNGQLASAWFTYKEAIAVARSGGQRDRMEFAQGRAKAIEPNLSYLTIRAAIAADQVSSTQILRDGQLVPMEIFGTPVPVDPGAHRVDATGAGKRPWVGTVHVRGPAAKVEVVIPALEPDKGAAVLARPSVPASSRPRNVQIALDAPKPSSTQRTWSFIVGGAGLAAAGAGALFAVKSSEALDEAYAACGGKSTCDSDASSHVAGKAADDARQYRLMSALGLGTAGAALVGGAVLFFTAPKREASRSGLQLAPARIGAGLSVVGSW